MSTAFVFSYQRKDQAFTKFNQLEITAQQAAKEAGIPLSRFPQEYRQWSQEIFVTKRARARLKRLPKHIKMRLP
jgi:predicted protein tyrosine phosphatase